MTFLLALLTSSAVLADDVSVNQALQIARQFAKNNVAHSKSWKQTQQVVVEPTLAYAAKSKAFDKKDNVYVINYGNEQGFVVVSGETGTDAEVLGFCDHGSFAYDSAPPQLQDLLAYYSTAIDSLRKNPALASAKSVKAWPDYIGNIIVEPLLTTTWNQRAPYNIYCPENCPTGCVATAVAQIMNYWKWPKKSSGKLRHPITLQFDGEDFSGHVYDWDNMLDDYDSWGSGYNEAQANAVAKLMADVGTALGTHYSPTGSGTSTDFLPLARNFGYDEDLGVHWENLTEVMKEELNQNRPMLYSAQPLQGEAGHELVVDGYTSNNYFHFNYGWGGSHDGFYKGGIADIYCISPSIVTGIHPSNNRYEVIGDMEYYLRETGEAEILSYKLGGMGQDNGELIIPATVTGDDGKEYKVTRIRQLAFYNKGNFSKVVIGDNVEAIDHFAFIYCKINELVLSDKMEVVPDEAFQTTNIKTLTIGANVKRVGKKAFYLCPLTKVTCKSPAFEADNYAFSGFMTNPDCGDWLGCITKLGYQAFSGVTFKSVPNFAKLEEIGPEAFAGCTFPGEEFVVPPTLKSISPDAFKGSVLSFFQVQNNPNFLCSERFQEYLCNNNGTSLIMTVNTRRFGLPLPETVIKLEPHSVRCPLTDIPATVVEMEGAFQDCPKMDYMNCYAVVPPIASDTTFNEAFFPEDPYNHPFLYVPQGTEDAYRNAPGWSRFWRIIPELEYNPAPAQGREYYMVLHRNSGKEQTNVSVPLSDIDEVHFNDASVVVRRKSNDHIVEQIINVDSVTWKPGFVYENAEIFELNDSTLTVEAQKCSVKFDATVIDEDVQLCVRNSVLTPKVLDGTARGFALDLSLSNGEHELCGTAEIAIPFEVGANEKVHAAYFNEESGEWEPVYFKYDKDNGSVVITTDHLSTFSIFTTYDEDTSLEYMELFWDECPTAYAFNEATKILLDIVSSDDPDMQMVNQFKDEMSLWQSVGLDGVYNMVTSVTEPLLKFKPEAIDHAVTAMGYLGTAISIVNVAGAAIKGDDVGVASGTLSTILNFATGQMASAIGTPIMSASMGCVAFIGIALNKFGTMVQERKFDLYNNAYHYFYTKEGSAASGGCYRSAKDWYKLFYPTFAEGNMNESRLNAYIEAEVRDYCDQFWTGKYSGAYTFCCTEKDVWSLTSYPYPEKSVQKKISDVLFSELMNGELVSVFTAIKRNLAVEANKRYQKAAKDVAEMMNTKLAFRFKDSSVKKGEKSKYAGLKVAFTDIPAIDKPEKWQTTVNDEGQARLEWFTEYALVKNRVRGQIILYDEKDLEYKSFNFEIPEGKGKVVFDYDLATGGVEVEAPKLKDLELAYDPDAVEHEYRFWGPMEGGKYYIDGGGSQLIYMSDPLNLNKKARFQYEIEKFFKKHDFITVDSQGNIKLGDDITGKMEGDKGTGKFTINTAYSFTEQTPSEFVQRFNNESLKVYEKWYNLLNGTVKHNIDCTFTVTRDSEDEGYIVEFTGSGTYDFKGKVVSRVDNFNWDIHNQNNRTGQNINQSIVPADLTIGDAEQTGNVTLKYTTKLK